jgi:hypothetical protein
MIVKAQELYRPRVVWSLCPYVDTTIPLSTLCTTHSSSVARDKALGSHALATAMPFGKLHAISQESQYSSELEKAAN